MNRTPMMGWWLRPSCVRPKKGSTVDIVYGAGLEAGRREAAGQYQHDVELFFALGQRVGRGDLDLADALRRIADFLDGPADESGADV